MIAVFIPDWHPTPLNKLLGNRWKAHALKKADRAMVGAYCTKVPKATAKRWLLTHIILAPGKRACDPDAYFKSLLDALVSNGLLVDDNRQGVECSPPTFERATKTQQWGTRITLIDIDILA